MSRTRKRPRKGAKRFARSCRNHGACEWCRGNRTHRVRKALEAAKEQAREVGNG